jgi:hypothetical protein
MNFRYFKNICKLVLQGKGSALAYSRYYPDWQKSLQPGSSSVQDRWPWITFPVIDLLKEKLPPQARVFEYGGGGSTLFFLDRVAELVTVEHNEGWFARLQSLVTTQEQAKWKGHFLAGQPGLIPQADPSNPLHYASTDPEYKHLQFRDYASLIDTFPEAYFDLVLVDGRARPSCIHHAISRIRTGGLLVVDNSDRSYYFTQLQAQMDQAFTCLFNDVAPSPYAAFFTQTGVWQKL